MYQYVLYCVPVCLDVHQCVPVYVDVHQCVPVYLDVHQFVPVYLDMWFVAWADQSAKCVYLNYCTLVIIIEIYQLVA